MKTKTILLAALAAGTLTPAIASAQSADPRHDRQDVREDRRDGDRRDARRDQREDWRDYRDAHRDVYRGGGAYVGPRGYVYRPVSVGHRFAPAYYGRGYWVNDYARYRLPAPGAHRRWVRYGNDVALVNLRGGQVVVVHRGFFW